MLGKLEGYGNRLGLIFKYPMYFSRSYGLRKETITLSNLLLTHYSLISKNRSEEGCNE